MTTKITTDWHLGVKRVTGTTAASQEALKTYLRTELEAQLDDRDHLICGDLFSDFTVDAVEVLSTYGIFDKWLTKYGRNLALVRGNHDYHESAGKISSFDLLGAILSSQFPKQVTVANSITEWKQFLLVPHLPNNEILNLEVSSLSDVSGKIFVFHTNVDNPFAAETQHSLNLTLEQVKQIVSQGNKVLCGHEHQFRSLVEGNCLILGNSAPSSVADCVGNSTKLFAVADGLDVVLHHHLQIPNIFAEVRWTDLDSLNLDGKLFIRVVGDAVNAQAADVMDAIHKFRQRSSAFVITNAVKIEGIAEIESLPETFEAATKFDVMDFVYRQLDSAEAEIIRKIVEGLE